LIAFVIFFNALRIRFCRFLDLLVYWCINGLLDNFCKRVFGISKLITALLSSTAFLVPSSRGFKDFSLGTYRYRRFVVLKLSYQIFGLSNTFFASWRRMGNSGVIIIALGNFLPLW
jgi:hypothetical protein